MSTVSVMAVLGILVALAGTVLSFIFILPEKKRPQLNKIFAFLHDTFNFKYLIIEKILQALYIFSTLACIGVGLMMLFGFESHVGYYSSYTRWYGGYGLLLAILGPIAVRIVYESIMMAILLVKNVIQINSKLKNQNEDAASSDIFAMPNVKEAFSAPAEEVAAPVAEQPDAAQPMFCTNCGNRLNADGSCPNGCK